MTLEVLVDENNRVKGLHRRILQPVRNGPDQAVLLAFYRHVPECSLPTYEKQVQIDEGGQGCVWRGLGPDNQAVALKFIKTEGGAPPTEEQLRRFEREVACQSTLQHPGVVQILAVDFKGSEPYFVMPLAEGSLLGLLADNPDGLLEEQAIELFRKVLEAVVYAHSEKVLHRDLKPGNVLLLNGEPALSDFGLGRRWDSESTKLTKTNFGLGTIAYAAPEQLADGHSADERADIFALGRLLYEMLTGKVAFLGVDMDLIPGKYKYFISTAIQNAPSKRFASTLDMARQFEAITRDQQKGAPDELSVRDLAALIDDGDVTHVQTLAQLLVRDSDDPLVYLKGVPFLPISVIELLATNEAEAFRTVIEAFDGFASGQHPWSFTDTIARFLRNAFLASNDIEVRRIIIVRLIRLGWSHNRFFVRERLVEVVRFIQADPTYTAVLMDIFESNKDTLDFSRAALLQLELPIAIRALLKRENHAEPTTVIDAQPDAAINSDPWFR